MKSEFRLNKSLSAQPALSNRIAEARGGVDQLKQYQFEGVNWEIRTTQNPLPDSRAQ